MPTRSRYAASLALIALAAHALAGARDASKPSDESGRPVMVKVASMQIVDAGSTKGDPRAAFGLVNFQQDACYAIAPPAGAAVTVGDSYAVVPASDVDQAVREKLAADYPKCPIVEAVAHVMR